MALVALLLPNESTDLVGLHIGHGNVANHFGHKGFTFLASVYEQPENGLLVDPADALCAANGIPLCNEGERQERLVLFYSLFVAYPAKVARLLKFLTALGADVALQPVPLPVLDTLSTLPQTAAARTCRSFEWFGMDSVRDS